jgi:hypothetical protein
MRRTRRATSARVSRCDEPAASPVAPVSVSFARRARTASPSRGEGGHPCPSRSRAARGRRRPLDGGEVSVSFARRARTASPSREIARRAGEARSAWAANVAVTNERLHASRGRERRLAESISRRPRQLPTGGREDEADGDRLTLRVRGARTTASRPRHDRLTLRVLATDAVPANVAVTNERLHASRGRERRLAEEHFASTSSASDRRERGRSRWRTSRDHGSRVALRRTGGVSGRVSVSFGVVGTRVRLVRAPREDGVALSSPLGKGGHPCPSRSCAGRGRRRRSLEVHLDGWRGGRRARPTTVSRFACSRRTQCLGRERRGHERTRITPRARRARARRARGRAPCGGACSRGASSGRCCRRARRRRRGST